MALLLVSCRSSLDADAFIANTLDGRAGEIRAMLRSDLPAGQKAALGQYLAAIEPLAMDGRRLLHDATALQSASRMSAAEAADAQDDLAARASQLVDRAVQLSPPPDLASRHAILLEAFAAISEAIRDYALAFRTLEFDKLRPAGQRQAAAFDRLRAALDDFEETSQSFLADGKRLRLR